MNITSIYNIRIAQLEDIAMKKFYLVCLTLFSFGVSADLTPEKIDNINSRVNSMIVETLTGNYLAYETELITILKTLNITIPPNNTKNFISKFQ